MKLVSRPAIFKSRQSDPELILCAVRGYLQSALPFREAAARLRARGLQADHTTLWRWVQRYGPELQAQPRRPRPPDQTSWHVDETTVRVKGRWCYLYRAALLHESELARIDPDPRLLHRPMRYDIGLPSPVI